MPPEGLNPGPEATGKEAGRWRASPSCRVVLDNSPQICQNTIMEKAPGILDKIRVFFEQNPKYAGIFIALLGVFMITASIFNWNWVFAGHSFNLKKIEGISNMFGRGAARVIFFIFGLFLIVFGFFWWFLLSKSFH
jgi:hypothetical protein